jgi:hypothetical protein
LERIILWHIINIYAVNGITEFIIALGYTGDMIKNYFLNFCTSNSDISIDLATGRTTIHGNGHASWTVHLVDAGLYTQTGGRLKRLAKWLEGEETFCFTYGDGVADLDLKALLHSSDTLFRLVEAAAFLWYKSEIHKKAARAPLRLHLGCECCARNHRVCNVDAQTLQGNTWFGGRSPSQIDRRYVECLKALGFVEIEQ